MKRLSIFLMFILLVLVSCTKSKEVHPEIGDGNDEILTVGVDNVKIKYVRDDISSLQKVMFHYSIADEQQYNAVKMTKKSDCFELTLNNLLRDTLYSYYYEMFPNSGNAYQTSQKTFHTQAGDIPTPPTPPSVELPTVVTAEVSEITTVSAVCGGNVTNDGGGNVSARGVCWSTNANPTISDTHVASGSGLGTFTSNITGLSSNTTYHVRAYATNEAGTAYGLDKEFTTLNGGGGEHDYVDLGLPSGLLWATCNVGAENPEDYGDYFAWGETTTKSTYDWSTYQYCNGSYTTLTKYCNNSSFGYNGFTDNLTTLLPEDDAATANWGTDWRMPTREEWQELLNNTTVTWTTQNGVNGRLLTASNGNSLFLPAAGYRSSSYLCYAGSYGYYWSSSLFADGPPYDAWYFDFDSGYYGVGSYDRSCGQSVRPVRSGQN